MSRIGAGLVECLAAVNRPGDFCMGGLKAAFLPAVEVAGVGPLAFPLLPDQAAQLVAAAMPAPYGRGTETLVDRAVRRTWQIDAGQITVSGRHWQGVLDGLVAEAATGLGVPGPVEAVLYKLLVYDAGSFFVDHRDTEKRPGMFATLTVVLPSAHEGGELVVRHLDRETVLELCPREPSEIGFAAFYADCIHEVRPVRSGCRLALVYNLLFPGQGRPQAAPDFRDEARILRALLQGWETDATEPDKLILALEHAYTPAELAIDRLKGADAGAAFLLAEAAAAAGCELHLALVTINESGSAEHTAYSGYRDRWPRDEDEEHFEAEEVLECHQFLSGWSRPDGMAAVLADLPFDNDELCPPDAFDGLAPDAQHFHEATGNEGASFERSYRRAALVLWPAARRLAVLNAAGLPATLPWLEALVAGWEAAGADPAAPERDEAEALAGHMLHTWPGGYRSGSDDDPGRMLDLLARLGSTAAIDAFLADLTAEGLYAARDNEAILRAAALLPAPRAAALLTAILRRNAASHLAGCGDLLHRLVTAATLPPADLAPIAGALLAALPGDPKARETADTWRRPTLPTADFAVALLTALSRIDAAGIGTALAPQVIGHMLAWPATWPPDSVLVPASRAFALQPETARWPAVLQGRAAALAHLRQRIAEPLQPPKDWARPAEVTCRCADCGALTRFLADPVERSWLFKAAADRRRHVEDSVKKARCDLDLVTRKEGSPHGLLATKNQASYDRRAAQRRRDLDDLAALDS